MSHRPFTLVLAGGGARGYAHVGVLRELEHIGLTPAGIVGVSMGAVVAATYAARPDWYDALMCVELPSTVRPGSGHGSRGPQGPAVAQVWSRARTAWNLVTGWGGPDEAYELARLTLDGLLGTSRLEDGRVPVVVCATDLLSGSRVEISAGPATEAVYASSALAGILPPAEMGERLLVDGVYTDIAPVDVARRMEASAVVVVDPSQPAGAGPIRNGLQAVMRAMEICHLSHAHVRTEAADVIVRPVFGRFVDVLDFGARRHCVAAGWVAARSRTRELKEALAA